MICYSLVVHGPSILTDFLYATTSGWRVVPLFFSCCLCCVKGFSVMMQQWYYCTMKPIISTGFHYKTLPLHRAKRTYTAVKVHLFWTIIYPCCDKHPRTDRNQASSQARTTKSECVILNSLNWPQSVFVSILKTIYSLYIQVCVF